MKQLLSLFLLLLPCLALAQYPSNGNQKITLGEQTTADGLIWRGVLADTGIITPLSDTSAYIILDTVNHRFYNYNRATNVWSVAGGGTAVTTFSGGTTGLTPNTATSGAVTLGGTLAVANGGTNTSTLTANKVMVGNGTSGVLTPTNLHWDNTNSRLGIGTASPEANDWNSSARVAHIYQNTTNGAIFKAESSNTKILLVAGSGIAYLATTTNSPFAFYTNTTERMRITSGGEVNIGYTETDNGAYPLQVNGQIFATNATIATPSDISYKENIQPLDKGLEIINKLKPKKFNFISTTLNNFSEFEEVGFIAQDVEGALSTELFAKSIVKKSDESKEDSTLVLMTQNLIPILTKAIQEQQSLIKALEQRIINLENK